MTTPRRAATAVLVVLVLVVLIGGYLQYRDRTVVLGELRGDSQLVAARSVRIESADVTPDGRHVKVRYIGGDLPSGGCREFLSARVTKHRGAIGIRVQEGVRPEHTGVCTLGGREKTLLVALRQQLPTSTPLHQLA